MHPIKEAVQNVIDAQRIGSPVFLRCILNIADSESLLPALAELAALANGWIPSPPERLYAQGDPDEAQTTAMINYAGGQIALLSANRVTAETALDIMLIGNSGVIYHETPVGRHYHGATPPTLGNSGELADTLTRSLNTGHPVTLTED